MSELLVCCSAHFAELQELLGSAGSSPIEMKGSIGWVRIGEPVLEISPLKLSESPASFCQVPGSFLPHPLLWSYLLRAHRWEGMARSAKIPHGHPKPWSVLTSRWTRTFPLLVRLLSRRWLGADTGLCLETGAPSAPLCGSWARATEIEEHKPN